MKKILMIATGGTIASAKGKEGLTPSVAASTLLDYVSEVKSYCSIETFQILNIDSTNMKPEYWVKIAEYIIKNYYNYDGFVITHGTDTMAYTSAALSYMLQNLNKPVVITGAQKPISEKDTDGVKNLIDAIRFSCEDVGGVFVVFDGKVILGTRATKLRTRSYNAFESINYPYIAFIKDGDVVYNKGDVIKKSEKPNFNTSISSKVFLLKLIPGIEPDILDFIKDRYEGLIIESYGSGGIPFEDDKNLLPKIKELVDKGIAVVVTTQVILEGSDLSLYEVGQKALKTPVIPAFDMTREAAVVKLMWALGQSKELNKVKEIFLTPVKDDFIY
ncbi:asparaginase [Caloramator quimbayensis]|uniref:asparaginase n=1 Tax=Caloramator quimbayensis TaxID=1147123 RepID=A0A1T4WS07_9CLOT|nr:asparaginase [Caloramator quimbayensis]SKA80116.1 asparaginase [Caloramator quimbayensis]